FACRTALSLGDRAAASPPWAQAEEQAFSKGSGVTTRAFAGPASSAADSPASPPPMISGPLCRMRAMLLAASHADELQTHLERGFHRAAGQRQQGADRRRRANRRRRQIEGQTAPRLGPAQLTPGRAPDAALQVAEHGDAEE